MFNNLQTDKQKKGENFSSSAFVHFKSPLCVSLVKLVFSQLALRVGLVFHVFCVDVWKTAGVVCGSRQSPCNVFI